MTCDDVIRMAREAGYLDLSPINRGMELQELERFAALVAAHEREECAKVCEQGEFMTFGCAAAAIRARGTPKPRCALCGYQHGHAIGCENNPVDIALRARGTHEA